MARRNPRVDAESEARHLGSVTGKGSASATEFAERRCPWKFAASLRDAPNDGHARRFRRLRLRLLSFVPPGWRALTSAILGARVHRWTPDGVLTSLPVAPGLRKSRRDGRGAVVRPGLSFFAPTNPALKRRAIFTPSPCVCSLPDLPPSGPPSISARRTPGFEPGKKTSIGWRARARRVPWRCLRRRRARGSHSA